MNDSTPRRHLSPIKAWAAGFTASPEQRGVDFCGGAGEPRGAAR